MIEVERRTDYHFNLPPGAELSKACRIEDSYYLMSPVQIRLRLVDMDFPQRQRMRFYTEKRRNGKALSESELSLTQEEFNSMQTELSGKYGAPLFNVSGYRREYKMVEKCGLTICSDQIDQLGKWSELEIMVLESEGVRSALHHIGSAFRSFGVPPERISKRTYPEMVYGNSNLPA